MDIDDSTKQKRFRFKIFEISYLCELSTTAGKVNLDPILMATEQQQKHQLVGLGRTPRHWT